MDERSKFAIISLEYPILLLHPVPVFLLYH